MEVKLQQSPKKASEQELGMQAEALGNTESVGTFCYIAWLEEAGIQWLTAFRAQDTVLGTEGTKTWSMGKTFRKWRCGTGRHQITRSSPDFLLITFEYKEDASG